MKKFMRKIYAIDEMGCRIETEIVPHDFDPHEEYVKQQKLEKEKLEKERESLTRKKKFLHCLNDIFSGIGLAILTVLFIILLNFIITGIIAMPLWFLSKIIHSFNVNFPEASYWICVNLCLSMFCLNLCTFENIHKLNKKTYFLGIYERMHNITISVFFPGIIFLIVLPFSFSVFWNKYIALHTSMVTVNYIEIIGIAILVKLFLTLITKRKKS